MTAVTQDTASPRFTVAAANLRPLAALAAASGVSLERMLQALGLPSSLLAENGAGCIGLGDYFRLLEHLSAAIQDETCHLSSRPLLPGSTHFAWSSIAGASGLYDAMKRVAKAYNMLHGGHYNHVEMRDDSVAYIIDDRRFPYSSREDESYIHFTIECVLAFLHGTLILVAGDPLHRQLIKVHTRRPSRVMPCGQLDFLDAPVRWNAPCYALVYDLPAAFLPIDVDTGTLPSADAVYRKIITLLDAGDTRAAPIRCQGDRVAERLRRGVTGQAQVAAELGMSVATLRRRLTDEGTSFRALRHQVLAEQASAMLRQGMHAAEVADQLGFADFRSFTRAFKLWTGMTPAVFRGRRRGAAGP